MKISLLILMLSLFGASAGYAQTTNQPNNPPSNSATYNHAEIYIGYSVATAKVKQYDRDIRLILNSALGQTFRKRANFEKGLTVAGVYNFTRQLGIKADISLSYNQRKGQLNNQNFDVRERLGTFTIGLQAKNNSKDMDSRVRPFTNVLAGVANTKSTLNNCAPFGAPCPNSLNKYRAGVVGIVGGGIDIKLTPTIFFRAIQADYLVGRITQGWRFSSGIVF